MALSRRTTSVVVALSRPEWLVGADVADPVATCRAALSVGRANRRRRDEAWPFPSEQRPATTKTTAWQKSPVQVRIHFPPVEASVSHARWVRPRPSSHSGSSRAQRRVATWCGGASRFRRLGNWPKIYNTQSVGQPSYPQGSEHRTCQQPMSRGLSSRPLSLQ
jgi:hypothetical protein